MTSPTRFPRASGAFLPALLLLLALLPPSAYAETRLGISVSARGFLSLGIAAEYDITRDLVAAGSLEIPLGYVLQASGIPAGRIALGLEPRWLANRWSVALAPDLVFVWHAQELGRYASIQIVADAIASRVGASGGSIGALAGLECAILTWIAPGEYVESTFEGIGQQAPGRGWYRASMFNTRLGLTASAAPLGEDGIAPVIVDGSLGLRLQPFSVAPPFSGFPYGNLPFFMEVRTLATVP